MTDPRQVLPWQCYMLTRRCTQRQLWLRPDEDMNQIWSYCLAEAAAHHDVDVVFTSVMSNHHHTIVMDRHSHEPNVIDFATRLHRHVAKCVNELRGRSENLWASEQMSLVALQEHGDVMSKMVYAATNPVAAKLVERVHHWPGVNAFADVVNDRSTVVKRPRCFFRPDGDMPEEVTLRYVLPPELGKPSEVRATLRAMVQAEEATLLRERRLHGRCVLGRRAVLRQRCSDTPVSREPRGELRPHIAARSRWTRLGALRGLREFRKAYRDARAALVAGEQAEFPPGTYWLRRFAGVRVAQGPPT